MTIKRLKQLKKVVSINAVLNEAFTDHKDVVRISTKISRGHPELTDPESKAIRKVLNKYGIDSE